MPKRKKVNELIIKQIKPWLFWKRCDKCKTEFVREKMWKVSTKWGGIEILSEKRHGIQPPGIVVYGEFGNTTLYFCTECFETEEEICVAGKPSKN